MLFSLLPMLLSATLYVDEDYTSATPGWCVTAFAEIQDAINYATNNDLYGETIYVYGGTYEPLTIGTIGLTIENCDTEDVFIDGDDSDICIEFPTASLYETTLRGLSIINGYDAIDGAGILIETHSTRSIKIEYCEIRDNHSDGCGGGILNFRADLRISNTTIKNNSGSSGGGIWTGDGNLVMQDVTIENNTSNYGGGICIDSNIDDNIFSGANILIIDNYATTDAGAVYLKNRSTMHNNSVEFNKTTICGNQSQQGSGGVIVSMPPNNAELQLINCIVWDNDTNTQITANYDVTYSCVEHDYGVGADHNIDDDPEFVDTSNDDYSLEYYSPCIDTGDDDIAYYDPDGSRSDMGYLYHEQDVYSWQYGLFERQYLWKSFPKLQINPNQGGDVDVENSLQSWNPLLDELAMTITFEFNELDYGEYDAGQEIWHWQESETISSIKGYKMEKDNATGCLLFSRGIICESDTELETHASLETWLGYFLEDSQLVLNAFPSSVLDDAVLVKTMDWTISRNTTNDRWSGATGSSYINYADCVVIETVSAHYDFTWETPSRSEDMYYRPVAEHFTFDDDIDYFPIYATFDVNDMPDEVAIYIDGVCHGAQVVEDTICQICAHILEEDHGQEIEFALWYDGRSGVKHLNNYQVFNESKGKYESKRLVTGMPGIHSKVYLEGNNGNVVPANYDLHCYPNPFNPELTISFNLEETQEVNLNVYNVKGQKVRTLVNETFRPDDYNIAWKGEDSTGNKVSSGVYYIRLQVGEDIVNRKVILMK